MRIVQIKGRVISGTGEGTKFTELPWAKKQITQKLGFTPYPGTLNIKITDEKSHIKSLLEKTTWTEISPVGNFCSGKLADAYFIDNLKCAIFTPEVDDYPEDVIELIAPINLRERFRLKDGDVVEVKIAIP